MSSKTENNDEFVNRLMTVGCPTGPLVQPFIMQAIEHYADKCIEAGAEALDTPLVSGKAWFVTAEFLKEEFNKRYYPKG